MHHFSCASKNKIALNSFTFQYLNILPHMLWNPEGHEILTDSMFSIDLNSHPDDREALLFICVILKVIL